jgi:aspartyl protease family protein
MDKSGDTGAIGRGMLVAAWVLVLALLTWLFDDQITRQFNPNRNPEGQVTAEGVREVTLQRNAQGHYVANGTINDRPVQFLLDTGATDVAVSEKLADALGLVREGGAFSQTANGVVPVWRSRLDTVALGPIRLHEVRASILPSMPAAEQVLLGMSFLKRLELVQRDGTLTLRQTPASR